MTYNGLERIKQKRQRLADPPSQQDEQRDDKESNLNTVQAKRDVSHDVVGTERQVKDGTKDREKARRKTSRYARGSDGNLH